jgi:hypothetical protein
MIRLVTLGGTGDAYMLCSLLDAFRREHNRTDVEVVLPGKYATIAAMFDAPHAVDDGLVQRAQDSVEMQRTYENVLIAPETTFYVHPCFLRSELRVDKLTTKPDASQADMYRMILRVPLDAPLTVPTRLPAPPVVDNAVLLIPEAVSWPNTQAAFWTRLAAGLQRAGYAVTVNNPFWSLDELFERAAASGWVIGPQCGVMSILVTGRFPCRKTLASPALNEANKKLSFLSPTTYPYAYVTKFSNADYDVEEFEVTDENHAELVEAIVNGANALKLHEPHDPRPVLTIQAPMAPGDFLDRLAVLTVKRQRFTGARRASIEREYRRFLAVRSITPMPPEVEEHFQQLISVHGRTFDLLETLVPAALAGQATEHDKAVRLNKDRIALKGRIDAVCRAPYTEEKSYW